MRIGFICEEGWSIENVYMGLTKELHKYGIDTHIYYVGWNHQVRKYTSKYSIYEWTKIFNNFDYIVASTGPDFIDYYNEISLPREKTILVLHAPWEIPQMVDVYGVKFLEQFASIISVSGRCIEGAKKLGVTTNIDLVQNGILFNRYYLPPAEKLINVGYPYPFITSHPWKRTKLAGMIDGGVAIPETKLHYSTMRQFYKNIEAIVYFSTTVEACGLCIMEASAAGRLVMSTNMGILEDLPESPVVRLRMEDDEVIEDINKLVRIFKLYPDLYRQKCNIIQEFAREYYDWSYAVKSWISAFSKLNT